jgi:hypothetical protein
MVVAVAVDVGYRVVSKEHPMADLPETLTPCEDRHGLVWWDTATYDECPACLALSEEEEAAERSERAARRDVENARGEAARVRREADEAASIAAMEADRERRRRESDAWHRRGRGW